MSDERQEGWDEEEAFSEAPDVVATTPTVFVADPSAEAGRVARALESEGYLVVDVPISMLLSRTGAQRPHVILVDADADGALVALQRVRDLPEAGVIDVLLLAREGGVIRTADDAATQDANGVFFRPVDVRALVARVRELTGGPPEARPARRSTVPPARLSSPPRRSGPPSQRSRSSIPPPAGRGAPPSSEVPRGALQAPPLPLSTPALSDLLEGPRSLDRFGGLSRDVEQVLASAAERVGALSETGAFEALPHVEARTPEQELEAVLPAEVLAMLDEALDEEDDGTRDTGAPPRMTTQSSEEARPSTSGGSRTAPPDPWGGEAGSAVEGRGRMRSAIPYGRGADPITGAGLSGEVRARGDTEPPADEAFSPEPTTGHGVPLRQPITGVGASGEGASSSVSDAVETGPAATREVDRLPAGMNEPGPSRAVPRAFVPSSSGEVSTGVLAALPGFESRRPAAPPARVGASRPPSTEESIEPPLPRSRPGAPPGVFSPGDAPRLVAGAVSDLYTGCLAFSADGVTRRLVLREGDFVTASSSADHESLVSYLCDAGEVPRYQVEKLRGRVPAMGRHAGAALVAHGVLGQDHLWRVLRAHAEFVAQQVVRLESGTIAFEEEAPGRLKAEPGVFGASTGAEVFVELLRRVVEPSAAMDALGGPHARIAAGRNERRLEECRLDPSLAREILRARGAMVVELVNQAAEPDVPAVLLALSLLAIVEIVPAIGRDGARVAPAAPVDAATLELEEEALRARVRARGELVDDGDYFALLGVPRHATGYEIRRAYLDLRRSFEPARVLGARTVDLEPELRRILVVLEEAYEILRDTARRERYRRAIEAPPGEPF